MLESKFQSEVISDLKKILPGCVIMKNDPNYRQGFPDLTIYYRERFALLECKANQKAPHRPNQDYYINECNNNGGFARFIFPENKEAILNELQQALQS